MNYKKRSFVIGVFVIAVIVVIATVKLTRDNTKTPAANVPTEIQNTTGQGETEKKLPQVDAAELELKKDYYNLMKDLRYMRYFSNFSNPSEIPENELVLFGYEKAACDEKTFLVDDYWRVKFDDINPYIKKYFNRTIISKKNTDCFNYDANKDEYVPTGWSFDGAEPHYLTDISYNSDGSITAVFDVYFFGELDLDTSPENYISDTSLIPSDIKHTKAESTFYRVEKDGKTFLQMISYKRLNEDVSNSKPNVENYFKAVPFSSDKYLSDDEFVIAGGVKLSMSYEEVLKILGGYDDAYDNVPGVKSILKDGYHYGFYQINNTFTKQSDLKIDGVFYLLNVSLDYAPNDEFPRGIKIGDSIEDVLSKFPGKDKKLRKWAYQNIYGKDKIGEPRAFLEFTMFDECYRILATTTKQILIVNFDRNNHVRSMEIIREDS